MNLESNEQQIDTFTEVNTQEQVQNADVSQGRPYTDYLRMGIIATEVFPPTSGLIRYGALAATEVYTTSPLAGAAVLGLTTLGLEWGSYRAAVGWIAENRISPAVDTIREKVGSYHDTINQRKEHLNTKMPKARPGRLIPNVPNIPENPKPGAKMPLWTQAVVGLEAGTVVLLSTKQEVDRSRDLQVNKRDGRIAVAFVAGVLAVQGALISEGVDFIKDDAELGLSAVGISALLYGVWKAAKSRRQAKEEGNDE